MFLICGLSNEARLFQSFQAVGKNVSGNAFGRILQLSIGHITPEQVPDYKQRPLVANQVERACDSAGRPQKTARFRFRLYSFRLPSGASDLHSESYSATFPYNLQNASDYSKGAWPSWQTPSYRVSISPRFQWFPA